jgi:membrane protease YdiL (CAAX protease family)
MEFKDIQNTWQQQSGAQTPPDFEPSKQKLQKLRKEQRITQFVLGITGIVLIVFFFYISAYKYNGTLLGMSLLIAVIVIRVFIEVRSRQQLKKINILLSLEDFKAQLIQYYEKRKTLTFRTIPALLIVYNIGVGIMMYYFYQDLSRGFFYYVLISYIVSFIVLFYFIRKQVLNELEILKNLQES